MAQPIIDGLGPWDRIERAMAALRDRLLRATAALEEAGVPYAVIGGNAVATWVADFDVSCTRGTVDVDLLLRRSDLEVAKVALAKAGFRYRRAAGIDFFQDGPSGRARDAVHVVFAGEKVRPVYAEPAPDVQEYELKVPFTDEPIPGTTPRRIVSLEGLVRMKLTSYRDKDKTHLRDMLESGTIDASWCERLPPALADRLRWILATPEG